MAHLQLQIELKLIYLATLFIVSHVHAAAIADYTMDVDNALTASSPKEKMPSKIKRQAETTSIELPDATTGIELPEGITGIELPEVTTSNELPDSTTGVELPKATDSDSIGEKTDS